MSKIGIASVLAVILFAASTMTAHAASRFPDMDGHWAESYIAQMRNAGVIQGINTPEGTFFYPNRNVSRAEFAAMLTRLLGIDPGRYSLAGNEFIDNAQIPGWARPYVAAMFQRGYITGRATPAGVRFDASSPITRAEAFTVLGRLLTGTPPDSVLHRFSDHEQIPGWARPEIARLVQAGLLTGTADGRLLPLNNITRAESAAILARLAPSLFSLPYTDVEMEEESPFELPELEDPAPPEEEYELPETDLPEIDPEPEPEEEIELEADSPPEE